MSGEKTGTKLHRLLLTKTEGKDLGFFFFKTLFPSFFVETRASVEATGGTERHRLTSGDREVGVAPRGRYP